jgi:hypothetical protein
MEIKKINIASNIVKSIFAFKIDSVIFSNYLNDINIITDENTLYILDFRNLTFDHYFIEPLMDFIKKTNSKESKIYIVFILNEYQLSIFFQGLLDALSINYTELNDGELINIFVDSNNFIKYSLDHNRIIFCGNLSDESKKVLNFINENQETSLDTLLKSKVLDDGHELVHYLDELLDKKFIVKNPAKYFISLQSLI